MSEIQKSLFDDLSDSPSESWRTFRIMAEMVNSFEILNEIPQKCVSIFGSARVLPDSPLYEETVKVAEMLGKAGYGILSGGGPGIMEAANKGATLAGAPSIGLHIHLPHEQGCNSFVQTRCNFRYFFVRKLMFVKYAKAYVVMPGGMGTIDELSEAFVLAQTKRIKPFPIILYKKDYWQGLLGWLKGSMVDGGFISAAEVDRYAMVCDSPQEVLDIISKYVL